MVASALDVSDELAASLLASGARRAQAPLSAPAAPIAARADRREQTELEFLGLCIDLPDRGRAALAEADPEDFTAERTRRAMLWLRDHLDAPLEGLPRQDDELSTLIGQLVMRAARRTPSVAALEAEQLRLQIGRLDRRIAAGDGPISDLAAQRSELKKRLDLAVDRAMA